MKKHLLVIAISALAASASAAVTGPQVFDNYVLQGVSPNGTWTVSCDEYFGSFAVVNLETGEKWEYAEDPQYRCGRGKCVSDNGVVVANQVGTEAGCYWEGGKWHFLPLGKAWGAFPNAVTPDGSVIAGSVSLPNSLAIDGVATVPAVWYRNSDGTYGDYVMLPFPTRDITNRPPQYLLIDDISADGNVLAGNMIDYSGMLSSTFVVTRKADGTWEYSTPHSDLQNPDGIEFPDNIGEAPHCPEPQEYMTPEQAEAYNAAIDAYWNTPWPEFTDFMTPEEYDAYMEALAAYEEDWEHNPFPDISDFMTEEELDAYNQALLDRQNIRYPDPDEYMTPEAYAQYMADYAQYLVDNEAYLANFDALMELFYKILDNPEVPNYQMNSARISPSGRYYMMSAEVADPSGWGSSAMPYVFDLQTGEYFVDNGDVIGCQVFDDGSVLGATPAGSYSRNAVYSSAPEAPFTPIQDLLKDADPELCAWIAENMTVTGTPVANADFSLMVSWTQNTWDMSGETPFFYSYVLPTPALCTVEKTVAVNNGTLDLKLAKDGVLTVEGEADAVEVIDVNGRLVFRASQVSGAVNTGLRSGAYLLKAVAADGTSIVKKAII